MQINQLGGGQSFFIRFYGNDRDSLSLLTASCLRLARFGAVFLWAEIVYMNAYRPRRYKRDGRREDDIFPVPESPKFRCSGESIRPLRTGQVRSVCEDKNDTGK